MKNLIVTGTTKGPIYKIGEGHCISNIGNTGPFLINDYIDQK